MKLPKKPELTVSLSGAAWVRRPSELAEVEGRKTKLGRLVVALTKAANRAKDLADGHREEMIWYATALCQRHEPEDESTKMQLANLATAARELLNALSALNADGRKEFALFAREACFLHPSPVDEAVGLRAKSLLSNQKIELLTESWELVAAVEALADYAQRQIENPQNIRKSDVRARHLVVNLAVCHRRLTGKFPPKDAAAWFAEFAALVGDYLGHKVGPKIIRSGIELAKNPTDDPEI